MAKTRLQVLLSDDHAEQLQREAMKRQQSVSSYIRILLNNKTRS